MLVAPVPANSALSIFAAQGPTLVAIRARDGSTRWTYNPTSEDYNLDNGLWYASGLLFGFTFSNSQPDHLTLAAVRAADGQPRWHVRVSGLIAPQVAVASDYAVLELGGQQLPGPLRVIRMSDGAQMPDIPLSGAGWIAAEGDTAFACTYNAVLTAYRLGDDQPLWTVPVAPGLAIPGEGCSLEAGGGIVFCHVTISTPQGQRMNELVAVRESDGHRLWQKPLGLDLLSNGTGYVFDTSSNSSGQPPTESLVAYRTSDGTTLWQIPVPSGNNYNIAAEGNVIVFAQGGDLRAVSATDGSSLWTYAHRVEHTLGVVAEAGGLVFALSTGSWTIHNPAPFGTDTRQQLLVLGASNGKLYWQMPLDLSAIAIGDAT
ncbi:MAG: PQQ-binding-like beta-propeller repeat protein [Ktedonobacterales bacterium]